MSAGVRMRSLLEHVIVLSLLSPGAARASVYVGATPYPTIADAVNAASSGDVLSLDPGVYSEPVDLAGKDLQVLGGGASAADVVISWDGPAGNDAVVQATGAGSTTIAGVTISSAVNRAIWSTAGALVLSDVVLSSALAGGADQNGGCVRFAGGALDVFDSVLTGCSAPGDGGAIAATAGAVDVWGSQLCGNSATLYGGAIYSQGSSLTVENTALVSNTAAVGGAIYTQSGGALVNDTFLANVGSAGGAVYADGTPSAVSFTNDLVAFTGDAGTALQWFPTALVVSYSAFYQNSADSLDPLDASDLSEVPPDLLAFSDDGDCANDLLRLRPSSALVDRGDPSVSDPDGSRSDIGAFGGSMAAPADFVDGDGDGYLAAYECDDAASNVFFGAPEHCDGVDEDCDAVVDDAPVDPTEWYGDTDGDGFGDPANLLAIACSGPAGAVADGTDCDPNDGAVFPGGVETCAPPDGNCDGDPVQGAVDAYEIWPDLDGDGFGDDLAAPVSVCSTPPLSALAPGDCDDSDPLAWDGNPEVCFDLADNDCSGTADGPDSADATIWYFDGDFDGAGDDATAVAACDRPPGYVAVGGDCDDAAGNDFPGNAEQCDFLDNDCDGVADDGLPLFTLYPDLDGDGHGDPAFPYVTCQSVVTLYVLDDTDCDDAEPLAWDGDSEVCGDGVDNDCSGTADGSDAIDAATWWPDADLDGFGSSFGGISACIAPAGYLASNTDCDDAAPTVFPGAAEVCNGIDDDCAGGADDGLPQSTFYADADGDGRGDPANPVLSCGAIGAEVANADDCDDQDPLAWTGNLEVCDGSDNDCSGDADGADAIGASSWYADVDGDGHGDPATGIVGCVGPAGSVSTSDDCDDGEPLAWTGATETCDGVDNDCDGTIDGADAVGASTWYADADHDGHGDPAAATVGCDQPPNSVEGDATDCDDSEPLAWTGNVEVCDGADNDCDGEADGLDAADATTWFEDVDGDGFGNTHRSLVACTPPVGFVAVAGDCADVDEAINPSAADVPNDGIDQDCSGTDFGVAGQGCGCDSTRPAGAWLGLLSLVLVGSRRTPCRNVG